MRNFCVLIFLVFCCCFVISADTKTNNSTNSFVPTNEWQVVPKETPIPPGLHIQHSFKTGITKAKLMDENEKKESTKEANNDDKKNSLTLHPEKSIDTEEKNNNTSWNPKKLKLDELKAKLKKIKADESAELIQAANEQVHSAVQKDHRTFAELKEEFESLSLNISTDAEILSNLFERYEPYKETIASENLDTNKVEDILDILNDMEYLLHQIDNAQLFADMEGMSKVISPSLNSTNTEIKAETLKLLGTACQLNLKVQAKALESDFVKKILYTLTIKNEATIKSRCLFALGAMIRNFPAAQKNFINNGGIEIFGKILIDDNSYIQIRVMNLINDLVIEHENLNKIDNDEHRMKKENEYYSTDFKKKLVTQKYCENLIDLTLKSLRINTGLDDFHKVIYQSLITLGQVCKNEFSLQKDDLLFVIKKMLISYRDFPTINEDNENLSVHNQEMLEEVRKLLIEEKIHDEL